MNEVFTARMAAVVIGDKRTYECRSVNISGFNKTAVAWVNRNGS